MFFFSTFFGLPFVLIKLFANFVTASLCLT